MRRCFLVLSLLSKKRDIEEGRKGDSSGRGTRDGPTTAKGEGEKGKGKKGGEGSEKKIQGRSRKERYNRERLT